MSKENIDLDLLKAWLDTETGTALDISVARIRGGGSCEMFELLRGDDRWVIRRAPLSAVSSTAHDVVREYKIINALQGGTVKVPELLAVSDNCKIAGSPFYIMRYIDGEVIRRGLPKQYVDNPSVQTHIGESLIDALVELHSFDWRNSSMLDMAKPGSFLGRQVERWMAQLEGYRSRKLEGVDEVAKWLSNNLPPAGDLTVMHGDYKLDNTMYSKEVPPKVLSIVDFEMTTIGDPLIDLAWAMIFWPEEGNLIAIAPPESESGMHADYCQAPEQLVKRYADKTGRDVANFQWYQSFAAWKLAIVLEASYAKFLKGESKNKSHEFFGFVVDELLKRAQRFAQ
ncbi:MAG: aminoglycoside phosphotransferase (APT) family kinase protein [Patiriisocius sp.]|jgi:aminoglycoside phosphotransferase (APT) family kinase protein